MSPSAPWTSSSVRLPLLLPILTSVLTSASSSSGASLAVVLGRVLLARHLAFTPPCPVSAGQSLSHQARPASLSARRDLPERIVVLGALLDGVERLQPGLYLHDLTSEREFLESADQLPEVLFVLSTGRPRSRCTRSQPPARDGSRVETASNRSCPTASPASTTAAQQRPSRRVGDRVPGKQLPCLAPQLRRAREHAQQLLLGHALRVAQRRAAARSRRRSRADRSAPLPRPPPGGRGVEHAPAAPSRSRRRAGRRVRWRSRARAASRGRARAIAAASRSAAARPSGVVRSCAARRWSSEKRSSGTARSIELAAAPRRRAAADEVGRVQPVGDERDREVELAAPPTPA